jgi:hypothetical protein
MDYILDTQRIHTGYTNSTSYYTLRTHPGYTACARMSKVRFAYTLGTSWMPRGSTEAPSETPVTSRVHTGYTLDTPWIHPGYTLDTPWPHGLDGHELETPWIHTGYKLDTHSIRHCVRNIMDYILDTQRIQTGYKSNRTLHTTHSGHILDTPHAHERAGYTLYTPWIHPGCPVDPRKHRLDAAVTSWIHTGYTMDTPCIRSGYHVGWAHSLDKEKPGYTRNTPWIRHGYTMNAQ